MNIYLHITTGDLAPVETPVDACEGEELPTAIELVNQGYSTDPCADVQVYLSGGPIEDIEAAKVRLGLLFPRAYIEVIEED